MGLLACFLACSFSLTRWLTCLLARPLIWSGLVYVCATYVCAETHDVDGSGGQVPPPRRRSSAAAAHKMGDASKGEASKGGRDDGDSGRTINSDDFKVRNS